MKKERVDVLAVQQGLFETRASQTRSDGWIGVQRKKQ